MQHDGARLVTPCCRSIFQPALAPSQRSFRLPGRFRKPRAARQSGRAGFVPRGPCMDAMPRGLGSENRPARFFG